MTGCNAVTQIGSCRLWHRSSARPQALISTVEQLYIYESGFPTTLTRLYLSQNFVPRIAPTLQELVGERVIEVLPALQCLFLEKLHPSGTVQEEIDKFVATRQLAEHPVSVSLWEREQDGGLGADGSSVTDGSLIVDGSSVVDD